MHLLERNDDILFLSRILQTCSRLDGLHANTTVSVQIGNVHFDAL